jgi:hypothetical protein
LNELLEGIEKREERRERKRAGYQIAALITDLTEVRAKGKIEAV